MRRRGALIAGGVVVLAAVGGGYAWWRLAGGSAAVSERAALREFRYQPGQAAQGPPRPGVYTYLVSGSECAGVAGFQLCRTLPGRARMIITRTADTVTERLDISQDHLELQRFQIRADGRYLVFERTRIYFAGVGQDDGQAVTPPTLALPARLRVGQAWTQRFSFGGLPDTTRNRVVSAVTLVVGGARILAYRIDAASITGGAHPGTEHDLSYTAPSAGLDVQLVIHRRIGGVFPYRLDATATLVSLVPAA